MLYAFAPPAAASGNLSPPVNRRWDGVQPKFPRTSISRPKARIGVCIPGGSGRNIDERQRRRGTARIAWGGRVSDHRVEAKTAPIAFMAPKSRPNYCRFVESENRCAELHAMAGDSLTAQGKGSPPASCSLRHPYVDPEALGDAGIGHPQPSKM